MITKNFNSSNLLAAICISALFISCSSDNKTWKIAKSNNDIISYEHYIEEYPKGHCIDSAKSKIENIIISINKTPFPPIQKIIPPISVWNNLVSDSISLQISINARQSKDFEFEKELEYYNFLKEIFDNIGIIIVPAAIECKTKLIVDLNFIALGSNYELMDFQYRGHKLTGKISLINKEEVPIILSINEISEPPPLVSYNKKEEIKESKKWKKPEERLNAINTKIFFWNFLYKVWGASPILWQETFIKSIHPELRTDYIGEYSDDLINNIIRACFSNNNIIKEKARDLLLLTQPDPKIALSIVLYDINNLTTLVYQAKLHQKSAELNFTEKDWLDRLLKLDTRLLTLIESLGPNALEITPNLIYYSENRTKWGWPIKGNERELSLDALRKITGKDFNHDIKGWRTWWFYNKKTLLDK